MYIVKNSRPKKGVEIVKCFGRAAKKGNFVLFLFLTDEAAAFLIVAHALFIIE